MANNTPTYINAIKLLGQNKSLPHTATNSLLWLDCRVNCSVFGGGMTQSLLEGSKKCYFKMTLLPGTGRVGPVVPATWKAKTEQSQGPGNVRAASAT